jgi:hypothetical protein
MTINDEKVTEHKDYQWSEGDRTQRLSMIKRKQNKKTINDQKVTEHKDSMIKRKQNKKRISMIDIALQRKLKLG